MLGDLERKLAAIVSDAVATRAHLSVATTPLAAPQPGQSTAQVTLAEITPTPGFPPFDRLDAGSAAAPARRRVLPVGFAATFAFATRPAAETPAARADARALLLEDVSAVAHALADAPAGDGGVFVVAAPDPGFSVRRFLLDGGLLSPPDAPFTATLRFRGEAMVWPVGESEPEGVIAEVEPLLVALPVTLRAPEGGLRPGGEGVVRLALGRALRTVAGAREASDLAVSVLADVPIGERGTVPAGAAGEETGLRILPGGEEVAIPYRAPAGDPGPNGRTEYLAIHLARPDGGRGLFLGSAAIRLVPEP